MECETVRLYGFLHTRAVRDWRTNMTDSNEEPSLQVCVIDKAGKRHCGELVDILDPEPTPAQPPVAQLAEVPTPPPSPDAEPSE